MNIKIGSTVSNGSFTAQVTGFKRVFGKPAVRVEWTDDVPIQDFKTGRVDVVPCLKHDTWLVSSIREDV